MVATYGEDVTSVQPDGAPIATQTSSAEKERPEPTPERTALVNKWLDRIKRAKKHHEKAFKRMRDSMELARRGATKEWDEKNYVVPIVARHINLSVAQLYAKNPRATAKPKPKLDYMLWDENPVSLQAALAAVQPPQMPMAGGAPGVGMPMAPGGMPTMPPPWAPDPNAMALIQEVTQVQQQRLMRERMGRTMEVCWKYYTDEAPFKVQLKSMVRRAKTCGAAFVQLDFQRALQPQLGPKIGLADDTSKLLSLEAGLAEISEGDAGDDPRFATTARPDRSGRPDFPLPADDGDHH